jgi:hypothetical protein
MMVEFGYNFRQAVAGGRSPALGLKVVEELNARGHTEEASYLLQEISGGIEEQIDAATDAGLRFKQDVVYPAQVTAPGSTPEDHLRGLEGLIEHQQPLLEEVNDLGYSIVLTRQAMEDVPQDLLDGLPAGGKFQDAYRGLVEQGDERGSDLNTAITMSTDAAVEFARMVRAGEREAVQGMTDAELDELIGNVRALPADNPFVQVLDALGPDAAAQRTALRADPDIAIAMLEHLASGPQAGGGSDVPNQPTGMFVVRMGEDFARATVGAPATKFTSILAAAGVPELFRPERLASDMKALVTLQFDGALVSDAWGAWFAGNAWRAWQVSRHPDIARLPGGSARISPIVGPLLDKSLLPLAMISTAEAFMNGRPIEGLAWLPSLLGSSRAFIARILRALAGHRDRRGRPRPVQARGSLEPLRADPGRLSEGRLSKRRKAREPGQRRRGGPAVPAYAAGAGRAARLQRGAAPAARRLALLPAGRPARPLHRLRAPA